MCPNSWLISKWPSHWQVIESWNFGRILAASMQLMPWIPLLGQQMKNSYVMEICNTEILMWLIYTAWYLQVTVMRRELVMRLSKRIGGTCLGLSPMILIGVRCSGQMIWLFCGSIIWAQIRSQPLWKRLIQHVLSVPVGSADVERAFFYSLSRLSVNVGHS